MNDGIEKEQAKKEYKRMIRPGSEHSSLYKSDKSYYLSTGHTITCINGQTFENFNNQIKELFNNKIYINLDSLNVMVKYIENPKKFEEIGFSEIMRDIKKSRNSRLNKSNIDYYRIKFNKSHMFISSETSLADIRKYGDRIFMDAAGTKKRIKNNKKRLGIDETKASINIKNSKISKLFKKIAPGIFDILPENILYKLSHVAYKIYIKGMGELRSFLGLEQIHINGWADRYNIYSILKDELWNIRKNSSKNVVKKINDTFADYGHNMYVVKSEKVY